MKLGPNGDFKWRKPLSTTGAGFVGTIKARGKSVYITGYFQDLIEFQGQTIRSVTPHNQDFFLAKYDSSSNEIWIKTAGGFDSDIGRDLAIDSKDNCYVVGNGTRFTSAIDFGNNVFFDAKSPGAFLAKFNSNGQAQWLKQFTNRGLSNSRCALAGDTIVYLATSFGNTFESDTFSIVGNSSSFNDTDVGIAKLDSAGNILWLSAVGGEGENDVSDLTLDLQTGQPVLFGDFKVGMTFGDQEFLAQGSQDGYVCQLDYSGEVKWASHISGSGFTGIWNATNQNNGVLRASITFTGVLSESLVQANAIDGAIIKITSEEDVVTSINDDDLNQSKFYFSGTSFFNEYGESMKVNIYTLEGKVVERLEIDSYEEKKINLNKGKYIYRVYNDTLLYENGKFFIGF